MMAFVKAAAWLFLGGCKQADSSSQIGNVFRLMLGSHNLRNVEEKRKEKSRDKGDNDESRLTENPLMRRKLAEGKGKKSSYMKCFMWRVLNVFVGMCRPLVFTQGTHLASLKPFSTDSFKGHQQIHLLHLYANICVRKCVWRSACLSELKHLPFMYL